MAAKPRIEAGDSAYITWRYRVNDNGLGTLTFTAGAEGLDSVNNLLRIFSNKVTRLVTMRHAEVDTIELASGSDSLSVIVKQTAQLEVIVKDRFGNAVIDSAVRFVVMPDSGGFNVSQTLKDTVIRSDANGKARITYYAPSRSMSVNVRAFPDFVFGIPDDTIIYKITILPAAISYLTISVDTPWTAGQNKLITVNAFDRFNNLNYLDTTTILFTGMPSENASFEPSAIQLDSGTATTLGRNTKAQLNYTFRATTLNTSTQRISDPIRIVHTTAFAFVQPDTVKLFDIIVNKKRTLYATVIDTFGNSVSNFTVPYAVTEPQGTGSIYGFPQYDIVTQENGSTAVIYTTGNTEGTNIVTVTGQSLPLSDTIVYALQTINPILPSRYNLVSIDPDTVSQKQQNAFRVQINNRGPFPITLIPDSTSMAFYNADSNRTLAVILDTLVKTLSDSAVTQVQFRAVSALLPAGDYPSVLNTATVRLVGTITDSASGLKDTVAIPLSFSGRDTLNVRRPAQLTLSGVSFELDSAVQGQSGIRVEYTVSNTGENKAVNVSLTDRFARSAQNTTGQWQLVADSLPAVFEPGITIFSRYYQIRVKSLTGQQVISSWLAGSDRVDPLQQTADSLIPGDSIKVVGLSRVQIVYTTVDTVYTDSLINRNQLVRIRSIIKNSGEEAVRAHLRFTASGTGLISDTVIAALNGNSSQVISSRYFNVQDSRGIETYTAIIDTLFSLVNGDTLTISDPIAGNTRNLVVQDSAKLDLSLTVSGPDPKSLIVSDSSSFMIRLRVNNIGEAGLSSDSIPVRVMIPVPYRFSYTGNRDTILFARLSQDLPVTVLAFDSTLDFRYFTARIDTGNALYPRDVNNRLKAVYLNDSDRIQIKASSVGRLMPLSFSVVSPQGAVDGTVSTFQTFVIRARVASLERLSNIRGTLKMPAGFSTPDSLSQNMNPPVSAVTDSVQWRIIASDTTGTNFVFNVTFSGEDTTTGLKRVSNPLTLATNIVRRAELAVSFRISDPPGAKDDTISTDQLFTVEAVVQNLGVAQASSGSLRLSIPAGFANTTLPDTQTFVVNTPVTWILRSPASPTFSAILKKLKAVPGGVRFKLAGDEAEGGTTGWTGYQSGLIDRKQLRITTGRFTAEDDNNSEMINAILAAADLAVSIDRVPVDTNTNRPAHVVRSSDTINVTVVRAAAIENMNLTMRNVVSTEQNFTVRLYIAQNPSLTSRKATLLMPSAFSTVDTIVKTMSDEDTVVTWTIKAPDFINNGNAQENYSIGVLFEGRDRNNQNPVTPGNISQEITVQTKPRLVMNAVIHSPDDAKDGFVSKGQSFEVHVNISKIGRASVSGTGSVTMDRSTLRVSQSGPAENQFRVTPIDTMFDIAAEHSKTRWLFTAPNDTVISHPLVFAFTSLLPNDSNTGQSVSLVNSTISLNISTEHKVLKVTNIPTWKDKKSAFKTEFIDGLLELKMENNSSTENTNSILAKEFRIIVEQYTPTDTVYPFRRVAPSVYLSTDSVLVRLIGEQQYISSSSVAGDTVVVSVNEIRGLSPSRMKASIANVEWKKGILINKNNPVSVAIAAKLAADVTQQNRNYRIRLVEIVAYDYDTLSASGSNQNNPLNKQLTVVDPFGRPISDSSANIGSVSMRFIDPDGSSSDQFSNYPNPFGSSNRVRTTFFFVPKQEGTATVEIYTLAGNLVRKISGQVFRKTIPSNLIWDGRNGNGDKVRNGVYIAVLKAPGMPKLKTKVLIAK